MVFNSPEFVLFLPIVFFLYWFVFSKSAKAQNIILLLGSVFFYVWADWRFLFLVIANALLNYFIGIKIRDTQREKSKQQFLWLGVVINLGVLGYFKYFNFFYDSFADVINIFGGHLNYSSLKILLPLGISFFTFQTLGYLIDIYNEETEPCRDVLIFSTYVLYFPKILAGPIERAQRFIPQIEVKRVFNNTLAFDGLRQILWGLFAKIVIADNCAGIVNEIFDDYQTQSGSMLLIGSFCYLIQIYCDFSGYSNIAIGVSKLLGIKLMTNFRTPFFSTNISDFWKKWHISLTSWLMDYVFTPLSFLLRKHKKTGLFIAIMITFILVGFWHGANWTFIVFGILQGLYFLPMIIRGTMNKSSSIKPGKFLPSLKEFFQMAFMFILLALTAVFFRAESVGQAFTYLSNIFTLSIIKPPDLGQLMFVLPFIFVFIIMEWLSRDKQHALEFNNLSIYLKWSVYLIIGFVVLLAYDNNPNDFIYLQF
jgi:D-alanyl-lipoteichoic acid acyltransferase DltB (MBOAT superfamily)